MPSTNPPACHAPKHPRTGQPAAYKLTYTTAPLTGRNAGPGLTLDDVACDPCRPEWAAQIEAEGGMVIGWTLLPKPPAPVLPAPVGLDAIAPPAPAEPVKIRLPRRRRRRARAAGRA